MKMVIVKYVALVDVISARKIGAIIVRSVLMKRILKSFTVSVGVLKIYGFTKEKLHEKAKLKWDLF